jgi:hypothetical protein
MLWGPRVGATVLSPASRVPRDSRISHLCCGWFQSSFIAVDGLPILLVDDERRRHKADKVKGEVEYNVKKIPPAVHQDRNAFVDRNTQAFFNEIGLDLRDKDLLAIGCSMAELEYYASLSREAERLLCLDIVPPLVRMVERFPCGRKRRPRPPASEAASVCVPCPSTL